VVYVFNWYVINQSCLHQVTCVIATWFTGHFVVT